MSSASPLYAPKPPKDELVIPEFSSGRIRTLEDTESVVLREIVDHWNALRGPRRLPSRAEIQPKNLKRLLRHVTLVKAVDNGADYEYRVVGDVQVQAYGRNFAGTRLSDVARSYPKFAEGMKVFFDGVRMGRYAFGYQGWIGRDMPDTKFSYHEVIYLPLGEDDETVDHILVAGVYVGRGGFHIG